MLLCIAPASFSHAQITFRVTGLPDSHPENAPVYVAGNFNGWQPGLEAYQLQLQDDGSLALTITPEGAGTLLFKFTRGSWNAEELDAQMEVMSNREWRPKPGDAQDFQIAGWKDLDSDLVAMGSTASERVQIWKEDLMMGSLGRTRRIWIYLPQGYEEGIQRYPVLYLHDGQNVFDAETSYAGEWGVDEMLDSLGLPIIAVGIDNGGEKRVDEYTPYFNEERAGGGEGSAYVDFIVKELKPMIDAEFRTLTDAKHTGIMGSSLGSLISLHAATRYPGVFSRLGLFSSALWINRLEMKDEVAEYAPEIPVRAYILIGGREGPFMVGDSEGLKNDLEATPNVTAKYLMVPEGDHSEKFWREHLLGSLQFLYPEYFQ